MSIIVNADYESVLFYQRPSLKMIRELEFLGLWLNDCIQNEVEYDEVYLNRISRYIGKKPTLLKKSKSAINWWGELKDLDKERYLNSKKTSLEISKIIQEDIGKIIENKEQLEFLDSSATYLFKSFSGVSGRGHKFLNQLKETDFPLIAETLHERELDFSTYCLESGERIFYQNFISPQFSYKGSFFDLMHVSSLENLEFCRKRPQVSWKGYLNNIDKIEQFIRSIGSKGFSIDSYVYEGKVRTLCEVNYRRTMGATALEIAKAISKKRFQLFLVIKSSLDYKKLCTECEKLEIVLLSHSQNMFSYILISEDSTFLVQEKVIAFELILGTSLAVKIE